MLTLHRVAFHLVVVGELARVPTLVVSIFALYSLVTLHLEIRHDTTVILRLFRLFLRQGVQLGVGLQFATEVVLLSWLLPGERLSFLSLTVVA